MFWLDAHWQWQQIFNLYWWPINTVLVLGLIWLITTTRKKPVRGLAMVATLLPTYTLRSTLFGIPTTYLEISIIIYCITALTVLPVKKIWREIQPYHFGILLFLIGATLGLLLAPDLRSAAGLWKAYAIEPLIIFLIAKTIITGDDDRRTVLTGLLLGGTVIAITAIIQYLTGFGIATAGWTAQSHRRVTSLFTSPNAVALYLAPILCPTIAQALANKHHKAFLRAACFVLLFGLITTFSDGAWVGLITAAIVTIIYSIWRRNTHHISSVVIGVILISGCILSLPAISWTAKHINQADITNRLDLWQMVGNDITTNPLHILTGLGIGGFAALQNSLRNPLVLEPLLYPHSIGLNFLVEYGLLGVIGIFLIMTRSLKTLLNRRTLLAGGILAALATQLIHGVVDVPFFKNDLAVLWWLLLALA